MEKKFNDLLLETGLKVLSKEITWEQATKLLNEVTGNDFGESTYRKRFTYFYEGMCYNFSNNEYTRILSISDLHIPFQKPISTFAKYSGIVDILQINGDVVDCQALSKFTKVYRKSPMEEIIQGYIYLIDLIKLIKPSKVIVNIGNHDIRFQNYIAKNLDSDILELLPRSSIELMFVDGFIRYDKESGLKQRFKPICNIVDCEIEFNDSWYSKIGNTIFCHPMTYSSGIMTTAERARRFFKDEGFVFDTLVMAHTHRIGYYFVGDTRIYEQGAVCETQKMNYIDGKLTRSQKEGFIYLCQDKDGHLIPDSVKQIELN